MIARANSTECGVCLAPRLIKFRIHWSAMSSSSSSWETFVYEYVRAKRVNGGTRQGTQRICHRRVSRRLLAEMRENESEIWMCVWGREKSKKCEFEKKSVHEIEWRSILLGNILVFFCGGVEEMGKIICSLELFEK